MDLRCFYRHLSIIINIIIIVDRKTTAKYEEIYEF